jgi:hypothetical protein
VIQKRNSACASRLIFDLGRALQSGQVIRRKSEGPAEGSQGLRPVALAGKCYPLQNVQLRIVRLVLESGSQQLQGRVILASAQSGNDGRNVGAPCLSEPGSGEAAGKQEQAGNSGQVHPRHYRASARPDARTDPYQAKNCWPLPSSIATCQCLSGRSSARRFRHYQTRKLFPSASL